MNFQTRRRRLRDIFDDDRCIHPGSVYDPLSARVAEDLGFEAGMFAGSTASLTVLGDPDIILLTLSEFADQAHRICRAGELPLIVDADHGYGNALNVKRTVEELETAGVSCLTIEDTLLPKRFGATGTEFLSVEEGVGKMKAALAGRQDPDLIVLGRTSVVGVNGVEDGIRRARAYVESASRHAPNWRRSPPRSRCRSCSAALVPNCRMRTTWRNTGCEFHCRGISRLWPRYRRCIPRSRHCATAPRQLNSRASPHPN
jgi:2-methylisocitrate lyase-like PEP mutase family enzyme